MKRRLVIEIDCGKKRCKRCDGANGITWDCDIFDYPRDLDASNRPLRLDACLEAERAAAPPTITIRSDQEWRDALGREPPAGLFDGGDARPLKFTWAAKAKP
jgi:hypothetical protein